MQIIKACGIVWIKVKSSSKSNGPKWGSGRWIYHTGEKTSADKQFEDTGELSTEDWGTQS